MCLAIVMRLILFYLVVVIKAETPEVLLSTDDLVNKYGYPIENHYLETNDGYTIKLIRIPHGRDAAHNNEKPIFVMHGLCGNAEHFIISGKYNTSLAYNLADNGYDVWLGNVRGNYPSRKHRIYSYKDERFWNYCWHNIGLNEVPLSIDYILNKTKKKTLSYVGFSQGANVLLVLLHYHPEYNQKIQAAVFMSPAPYLGRNKSLIFRLAAIERLYNLIKVVFNVTHTSHVPPLNKDGTTITSTLCKYRNNLFRLCEAIARFVVEQDSDQLIPELIPLISKNLEPASMGQLNHFAQIKKTGKFEHLDYQSKNKEVYGSDTPPLYNLSNAVIPIAVFSGKSDTIVNYKDVQKLCRDLPNCVLDYTVQNPRWNHIDFTFSRDGWEQYQKHLIKFLEKYYH